MLRRIRLYDYCFGVTFFCAVLFQCCSPERSEPMSDKEAVVAWADMALYITKNTPSNSPTYASRCFGYFGVCMYESIVHAFPEYQSLSGQLNGYSAVVRPEADKEYHWMLSLNAAQASILRKLYSQTSELNISKIDSLEINIQNHFTQGLDEEAIRRSISYGQAVADEIFEWSKTDGGHRGYLANFDKKFVTPKGPGKWEPPLYGQSFSHFPLHPHWGDNRTFLISDDNAAIPAMIPFDTAKNSGYYKQHLSVYDKSKTLTQTDKEIALWWGDDPSDTFTPPGHSFYLATQVLKNGSMDVIRCAETYARVGMAVADAFILCWKWKYHYCSERPSSYITRYIDSQWESFWPDPPFPAFPSGHAIQAGTTAQVLLDLYGENCDVMDQCHINRPMDELRNVEFKARKFSSFRQIADEIASSRFYGGIHSPQDNEVGLSEGKKIAENVSKLQWRKPENYATVENSK